MITDFSQLDLNKQYSYGDYLTCMLEDRVELFKGWVKKISPAPNRSRKAISWHISRIIGNYLVDKECAAYAAPFDVRLIGKLERNTGNESIYTVLQPDISVICDKTKLDTKGCIGAPDWIIEIVSPGNTKKEVDDKFKIYEENGVTEYWIIQPTDETVTVFDLVEGSYLFRKIYNNIDKAPVRIFRDFEIDLTQVFKK